MTILSINNHEDHRNITVDSGTVVEIKIDGNVVYTKTVTAGKNANIAFQLQEVNPPKEPTE